MGFVEAGLDTPRRLQEIANLLAATRKVIVVTGAGISTNCGIPVSIACSDCGPPEFYSEY